MTDHFKYIMNQKDLLTTLLLQFRSLGTLKSWIVLLLINDNNDLTVWGEFDLTIFPFPVSVLCSKTRKCCMFLENTSATEDAAVIGGLSWKWWFSSSIIKKPNNRFMFFIDLHQQLCFFFFFIVQHHQVLKVFSWLQCVWFNVCYTQQSSASKHRLLDISDILHIRCVFQCMYSQFVTSGGGKLSLIKMEACLATRR